MLTHSSCALLHVGEFRGGHGTVEETQTLLLVDPKVV